MPLASSQNSHLHYALGYVPRVAPLCSLPRFSNRLIDSITRTSLRIQHSTRASRSSHTQRQSFQLRPKLIMRSPDDVGCAVDIRAAPAPSINRHHLPTVLGLFRLIYRPADLLAGFVTSRP